MACQKKSRESSCRARALAVPHATASKTRALLPLPPAQLPHLASACCKCQVTERGTHIGLEESYAEVQVSLLQRGHISEQSQWYIAHGVVVSGNKSHAVHTQ